MHMFHTWIREYPTIRHGIQKRKGKWSISTAEGNRNKVPYVKI